MCPKQALDHEPDKVRRHLPKLVGRDKDLQVIKNAFNKAIKGRGSMVLIEGETGTGKTRLLSEMEKMAREAGLRVLWARCIGGAQPLLPFLNALENVSGKATAMGSSIEEVFYLHSDGRLILHETQRQRADVTDEELRGLLQEIKKTSKAGLRGLFLGDRRIMVEVGAVTVLAAVVRGEETPKMRQQMRYLLATVEDKFGEVLMDWKGRVADLKGLRDSMKSLLLGDYGRPEVLRFDFELTSPTVSEDIAKFLVASSREIPMAILFDDVHWMDTGSLELMELLCRRNPDSRLVIMGSYRPEEVDRQEEGKDGEGTKGLTLRTVMGRLESVSGFIKIKLGPLTKEDIGEMLASVYVEGGIRQDFIDFVFRHGGGNPFYTEEILRSLEDSGKLWLSPDGWVTEDLTAMDIPVTIKEAVHVRMVELSKKEREVLQHAAAIGREWELDILVRVLKDPSGIEDILDRLERTKLIVKMESGHYRFEHDIVREIAYEEMSEALRKLYHRKIGEAFEALRHAREGPDETVIPADDLLFKLAGHYSRSKDMEKALKYNSLAGDVSREKHDLKGAEMHFSRSLTAARALRDRDGMIKVLFELATVQEMNGEWDQALSNYNELLSMLTVGEEKERARTLVKVATIYEWRDEWNSSMENLEEALDISERIVDRVGKAMALAEKGRVLRRLGNYDQSFSLLNETLELLDELGKGADRDKDDERLCIDTMMRAMKERAGVHYYRGAYVKAETDYQTSLKMAREIEDEALEASVLMNLGITYVYMDQVPKGIEHYERSIDIAARVGNLRTLAYAYANLAEVLSTEKRFDEAASYIRKALEVFYRLDDRLSIAHTHMIFGLLMTEKEELDEAVVHFNMALEMALPIKENAILAQIYSNFARLYVKKGDAAMARKLFKKAITIHTEAGRTIKADSVRKALDELERTRRGRIGDVTIGRKDEMIALIRNYRLVEAGRGKVVVIEGETGTGKTKLIEQFMNVVKPHNCVKLVARCMPREETVPYSPFIEALEALLQREIPIEALEEIKKVVADNPVEMLRIFPMLGAIPEIARLAARTGERVPRLMTIQKEKDRLFENIKRLLLSFTRSRTVILILDDFHWADVSSIGLLHYLARNSGDARIMIIVTYSPDIISLDDRIHPLVDTLRLMNREKLITNVKLRMLSEHQTRGMISALLDWMAIPDEVANIIYHETEGNPFLIEEVVVGLIEQGIVDPEDKRDPIKKDLSEIKVPKTMNQVVERRLASLTDEERDILRLAAVIGDKFEFETLMELTGMLEDRLVGVLDKLMEKGLIIEDEGDEDSFRFPIIHFKRVLTDDMPPSESIKLHGKVAEILERSPRAEDFAFDLAYHHQKAGNLLSGARWALAAGERARRFAAPDEAANQLRKAASLLEQLPPSKEVQEIKARVFDNYGDISYKMGNHEEAAQNYLYLLETAKDLDNKQYLGMAYLGIGKVRSGRGAHPQAKDSYRKALDIFMAIDDEINIINTRKAISTILWREGQFEEAVGELIEGRELARKLGDEEMMGTLESALGNVHRDMGDWDESIAYFQKAITRLEKGGDKYELGTAYNNIGATYRYMCQWDDAISHFDKCIDLCKEIKFKQMMAYGLKNKGECLAKRGDPEDLDEADGCVDEAMAIFEALVHKVGIANCHMIRGIIQKFMKDGERSSYFFEKALTSASTAGVPDLTADIHYEYALSLMENNDLEGAREQMMKALKLFEQVGAAGRIERAQQFLKQLDGGGGG